MNKIGVVRGLSGYTMSRDYPKLWKLARKQSVVCVVARFLVA